MGKRPGAPQTHELLDRIAEALGGRELLERVKAVHSRGTVRLGGGGQIQVCGYWENWFTSRGELRNDLSMVGDHYVDTVFQADRKKSWIMNPPDEVRKRMGEEKWNDLHGLAYLNSCSWLFPGRLKGKVTLLGLDDSGAFYIVDVLSAGGTGFRVWVNRGSFLPEKIVYKPTDQVRHPEKQLEKDPVICKLQQTPADLTRNRLRRTANIIGGAVSGDAQFRKANNSGSLITGFRNPDCHAIEVFAGFSNRRVEYGCRDSNIFHIPQFQVAFLNRVCKSTSN